MAKRMKKQENEDFEGINMMTLLQEIKARKQDHQSRQESVEENTKEATRTALKPFLEIFERQAEERQQIFAKFSKDVSTMKDKEEEEVFPKNEDELLAKNLVKKLKQKKAASTLRLNSTKKIFEEMFQKFDACEAAQMEQLSEMVDVEDDPSYDNIFQAAESEKYMKEFP